MWPSRMGARPNRACRLLHHLRLHVVWEVFTMLFRGQVYDHRSTLIILHLWCCCGWSGLFYGSAAACCDPCIEEKLAWMCSFHACFDGRLFRSEIVRVTPITPKRTRESWVYPVPYFCWCLLACALLPSSPKITTVSRILSSSFFFLFIVVQCWLSLVLLSRYLFVGSATMKYHYRVPDITRRTVSAHKLGGGVWWPLLFCFLFLLCFVLLFGGGWGV